MAVGDRIKVALETDVATVQSQVDAGALEITNINDIILDDTSGNEALKLDYDDINERVIALEGSDSTSKSVIIDITNSYSTSYASVRSVDFYKNGNLISMVAADFDAYATTEYNTGTQAYMAFDTSLSKIGANTDNCWLSEGGGMPARLIIVFDNIINFDEIRVTNAHSSGGATQYGIKSVVITASTSTITDTTPYAFIPEATVLYTGDITEHVASNILDEQSIPVDTGAPDTSLTDRVDELETSVENIEQVVSDGGIVGRTTLASTGEVGEMLVNQYYDGDKDFSSNTTYALGSVTLSPGIWLINGSIYLDDSNAENGYRYGMINNSSSWNTYVTALVSNDGTFFDSGIVVPTRQIRVTATSTYSMYFKISTVCTEVKTYARLEATRIA